MKNGSEKQIKWANEIKKNAENKVKEEIARFSKKQVVMKAAWRIKRRAESRFGEGIIFGECLKLAWQIVKEIIRQLEEILVNDSAAWWIDHRDEVRNPGDIVYYRGIAEEISGHRVVVGN